MKGVLLLADLMINNKTISKQLKTRSILGPCSVEWALRATLYDTIKQ